MLPLQGIPDWQTKILQAAKHSQKINKFKKIFNLIKKKLKSQTQRCREQSDGYQGLGVAEMGIKWSKGTNF